MEVPEGAAVSAARLRETHHVPISVLGALLGLLREAALAAPEPGMLAAIDEVWPGLLHDADDLDLAAWAACAIVAGRIAGLGAAVAEEEHEASRLPGATVEAWEWLAASHRESGAIADHARSVAEAFATATEHVSEGLVALFSTVSRIAEEWPAEIMGEDVPDVIGRLLHGDPPTSADWMRTHVLLRGAGMVERLGVARQRFQEAREHSTNTLRTALLESPDSLPGPLANARVPGGSPLAGSPPDRSAMGAATTGGHEPLDAGGGVLDLPAPVHEPVAAELSTPQIDVPAGAEPTPEPADEQLAEDPGPAGLLSRASEFGSRRRAR